MSTSGAKCSVIGCLCLLTIISPEESLSGALAASIEACRDLVSGRAGSVTVVDVLALWLALPAGELVSSQLPSGATGVATRLRFCTVVVVGGGGFSPAFGVAAVLTTFEDLRPFFAAFAWTQPSAVSCCVSMSAAVDGAVCRLSSSNDDESSSGVQYLGIVCSRSFIASSSDCRRLHLVLSQETWAPAQTAHLFSDPEGHSFSEWVLLHFPHRSSLLH